MADEPRIAFYVSSVAGRLASRPGAPHSYIGAKIPTPDERKAGASEPTWQPEVVVPVLDAEYFRYLREWDALVNSGDVLKRDAKDFEAYTKALETAEAKREKDLEAERKRAEAAAKKQQADEKPAAPAQGGSS